MALVFSTGAHAAQQRNAPCVCGSGLRYKHCCGRSDTAPPAAAPSAPYRGWEDLDRADQAALWRMMQDALAAQRRRQLDVAAQARITDAKAARALMLQRPSVIKRPVVEWDDGRITVGFDAAQWGGR